MGGEFDVFRNQDGRRQSGTGDKGCYSQCPELGIHARMLIWHSRSPMLKPQYHLSRHGEAYLPFITWEFQAEVPDYLSSSVALGLQSEQTVLQAPTNGSCGSFPPGWMEVTQGLSSCGTAFPLGHSLGKVISSQNWAWWRYTTGFSNLAFPTAIQQ